MAIEPNREGFLFQHTFFSGPGLKKACFVVLLLLFSQGWPKNKGEFALDFVDTPITEVVRAVSVAYNTSILVDEGIETRVTFHLENSDYFDGLSALCLANHLELHQENGVLHIRKKVNRGEHEFTLSDSLVSLSVKDKDVREFVHEYSMNSGLNILVAPEVIGKVSGELRNMKAEDAFVKLITTAGFRVKQSKDVLVVLPQEVGVSKSGSSQSGSSPKSDNIKLEQMDGRFAAEIHDASLGDVLQSLAETADLNLAVYGDIRENVNLKFDDVDLKTLVDALFKGHRYSYALDSNNLFVSESGMRKALSYTKLYPLKHLLAEKALSHLAKFSPSAEFTAAEVKEQNALLLGGSDYEIKVAENLLQQIDVPAIQVTLSCIVVEFKRGKNFEIGLHGGSGRKTGEYNIGARGFLDFVDKDFSVSGAFGKIGLLPDRFELELSAMEERNEAEVLARPRLTTLNGNKAELNVTNTVYYLVSQVTADGFPITDYRSFNDGISLELTPSVTREGVITLEVSPEIKTAGRSTGDGPRDISTRNLKTVVSLKDGETLCLGGLIRKNKSEVRSAVPFLGSIPVIGQLFSYVSEVEEENELAIFITPKLER